MPLDATNISGARERAKALWNILRQTHGNPTLDIVREHVTGANAAKGVKGTVSDIGVQGIDCSSTEMTIEEKMQSGFQVDTATRRFVTYGTGGLTLRRTDKIRFPSGAGQSTWNIKSIAVYDSGRVEITAVLEKEKTDARGYY